MNDAAPLETQTDWALVRRQITGILRMEMRKNLLSRRAFVTYFLAYAPVVLVALAAMMPLPDGLKEDPEGFVVNLFPVLFEGYLRTSIFLASLVVFMSLFRNEIMEKSLHYLFLTPVRREVLVAGKYLSMQAAICTIFVAGTVALFFLVHLPFGLTAAVRMTASGFGNLLMFSFVTVLACIGYGAVFLLVGLFFRNPIGPAVLIWGWESINFVLPTLLKKLSVIHYLHSLYPIPLPATEIDGFFGNLFAVVSESTSPWVSVPGLLIFTGLVLFVASWQTRRMEINYGGE